MKKNCKTSKCKSSPEIDTKNCSDRTKDCSGKTKNCTK